MDTDGLLGPAEGLVKQQAHLAFADAALFGNDSDIHRDWTLCKLINLCNVDILMKLRKVRYFSNIMKLHHLRKVHMSVMVLKMLPSHRNVAILMNLHLLYKLCHM